MAWNSFHYVENQGEITGKSFRTQTEQVINDIAEYAESAVELGIGDAAEKAGALATVKAIEAVKDSAVLTEPQTLTLEKKEQARANIGLTSVVNSVNGQRGEVVIDLGVESFNGQKGEVTYSAPVQSVNGATGEITSDQLGCLPSTGGTVTGNVDLGSNSLILNEKGLYGSSRGLVYGGKIIPTADAFVTETWHSGANWYRVWSDGFIEQGGSVHKYGNYTVTLNKKYNSNGYTLVQGFLRENYSSYYPDAITKKTNTSFSVNTYNHPSYLGFDWYACGY